MLFSIASSLDGGKSFGFTISHQIYNFILFAVTKSNYNCLTGEPERKEVKRVGQESLEKRYKTYYMRVFSYAMTLTENRAQAEEITQETFFRAFLAQDRFRGESDEATWLLALCHCKKLLS